MDTEVEVSILVPAYNEAENLPPLLEELRQLQQDLAAEILVIDDGSCDRTSDVAQSAGVRSLRLVRNQGKGAALRAGFEMASGKYLVQIDADRQFLVADIPRVVAALRAGADIVFGSRFVRGATIESGSMAMTNRMAHWVICRVGWFVSGIRVHDVMAGFKGFRRECTPALHLQVAHFGYEAEILVRAGQLSLRVVEVPVAFLRRRSGTSNVKKWRDGCRVLATIAHTAWQGRRRSRTAETEACAKYS